MIRIMRVVVVAAACAGTGATAVLADAAALDQFAGAKEAIMNYYAANVRESDCGAGSMNDIAGANVVSQSADAAVVAINYTFSATPGSAGTQCSGSASRQFTLAKSGAGWTVTGASGTAP